MDQTLDFARRSSPAPVPARAGKPTGTPLLQRLARRVLDGRPDQRAGLEPSGETVRGQLEGLPDGWTVLHDVPVGFRGGALDHLVIGPGGAFALDAQHHATARIWATPRSLVVNGHHTGYLPRAVALAGRAATRMSAAAEEPVTVRPVLVFVGGQAILRGGCADVTITDVGHVRHWLEGQPRRLDGPTVLRLTAVAGNSATWQSGAAVRTATGTTTPVGHRDR